PGVRAARSEPVRPGKPPPRPKRSNRPPDPNPQPTPNNRYARAPPAVVFLPDGIVKNDNQNDPVPPPARNNPATCVPPPARFAIGRPSPVWRVPAVWFGLRVPGKPWFGTGISRQK